MHKIQDYILKRPWLKRSIYTLISLLVFVAVVGLILFYIGKPQNKITWGITYSTLHAKELGFDPQLLFKTMLTDLQPKVVRLPAYWSELEAEKGQFNFSQIEGLLSQTEKTLSRENKTEVLLVIGLKQPRWPECHQPAWYNDVSLQEQEQTTLNMIYKTVNELKKYKSIKAWQIENEPYFAYGPGCPEIKRDMYSREIEIVKSLDTRPIVGTDSGEKGLWIPVANSGVDILGATMYREAYYEKQEKYITYPLPWWTYNIKAGLVKLFSKSKNVIGVELQAEPWLTIANPKATPPAEQLLHMNPIIFQKNINYATNVGFSENYLWGVEWWYWMQREHSDNSMTNKAKEFFKKAKSKNSEVLN